MRILHCIDTIDPVIGGPSYYVRAALGALRQMDCRADLATLDGSESSIGELLRIPERRPHKGWRTIYSALRKSDVIHLHGFFSRFAVMVFLLCRWLGKPLVLTVHGQLGTWCLEQGRSQKTLFLSLIGRRILRRSQALVALSSAEKSDLQALTRSEIIVAEPAVPQPGGIQCEKDSSTPIRVLFLGRLHPVKRVELIIQAIAKMQKAHRIILDIAGDGAPGYVAELAATVSELGLSESIRFHGFVEGQKKHALMTACDVFVLPSAHENFAVAAAEAMSYGLPVILSASVAISGEVARAGAGIRLAEASGESIAEALGRLTSPEERRRMGAAGKAFSAEHYSPRNLSAALMKAYQLAVASVAQPD